MIEEGALGEMVVVAKGASIATVVAGVAATVLAGTGAVLWWGGDGAPEPGPVPVEPSWVPVVVSADRALPDAEVSLRRIPGLAALVALPE